MSRNLWRVYDALGRCLYYAALPLLWAAGFILKPRARVLVLSPEGEVLLVKNWLGPQRWTLPGGGVKRGEQASRAAVRELFEETGINASRSPIHYLGRMKSRESIARFRADVYAVQLAESPLVRLRRAEVISHVWVRPDEIPTDAARMVAGSMQKYKNIV